MGDHISLCTWRSDRIYDQRAFWKTKELWIDRRKNSKCLAWSSVLKAFEKTEGKPVVSRPKALGDIRGVSYLYGIFYKFGLIDVPDDLLKKYQK